MASGEKTAQEAALYIQGLLRRKQAALAAKIRRKAIAKRLDTAMLATASKTFCSTTGAMVDVGAQLYLLPRLDGKQGKMVRHGCVRVMTHKHGDVQVVPRNVIDWMTLRQNDAAKANKIAKRGWDKVKKAIRHEFDGVHAHAVAGRFFQRDQEQREREERLLTKQQAKSALMIQRSFRKKSARSKAEMLRKEKVEATKASLPAFAVCTFCTAGGGWIDKGDPLTVLAHAVDVGALAMLRIVHDKTGVGALVPSRCLKLTAQAAAEAAAARAAAEAEIAAAAAAKAAREAAAAARRASVDSEYLKYEVSSSEDEDDPSTAVEAGAHEGSPSPPGRWAGGTPSPVQFSLNVPSPPREVDEGDEDDNGSNDSRRE